MRCFALRLVVALLTFFVGVTAAALWYSGSTDDLEKVVTPPPPPRLVAYQPQTELPPPPPATPPDVLRRMPTVVGGVLNGKAISKPMPAYPPIAKAARVQGTVVVEIVVGESGDVISANAVSGHPLLQQAARAAALQAKFSPTRLSGTPVKVSGTLTYNFVLE